MYAAPPPHHTAPYRTPKKDSCLEWLKRAAGQQIRIGVNARAAHARRWNHTVSEGTRLHCLLRRCRSHTNPTEPIDEWPIHALGESLPIDSRLPNSCRTCEWRMVNHAQHTLFLHTKPYRITQARGKSVLDRMKPLRTRLGTEERHHQLRAIWIEVIGARLTASGTGGDSGATRNGGTSGRGKVLQVWACV